MDWTISLAQVSPFGRGLNRPEGVMVARDGIVWCSCKGAGCTRITPDGHAEDIGRLGGEPNGICIVRDGSVVVANIGNGEVQRLYPDGRHDVLAWEIDGQRLTTPNFPVIDSRGRVWLSHSTRLRRHFDATRTPIPDGTICVIESGHTRVVAEGIRFANGVALDAGERFLYVAETMGCCILRYLIHENGTLGRPEQYGPHLGENGFPDGIAFDDAGNLWVTLVVMNAIALITPDRALHIVLHDPSGDLLNRPTNIAFGHEGLKTAYVGNLRGKALARFEVPIGGMPLIHQR